MCFMLSGVPLGKSSPWIARAERGSMTTSCRMLPDDLFFQAPTLQMRTPDGKIFLEGVGVVPNEKGPTSIESRLYPAVQELAAAEKALQALIATPQPTATPNASATIVATATATVPATTAATATTVAS